MIPVLLILIPLVSGIAAFFLRDEKAAKSWALVSAFATLLVSLFGIFQPVNSSLLTYDASWLPMLGSRITLGLDGMGKMLTFLTAFSFPVIFLATSKNSYKNAGAFYGFMLLSQAGLTGVFSSMDLLLFYFFWELALIPVYFLCSKWGGERRIPVTFKFFIYTFTGSLLMLIGILYLYFLTPDHSFSVASLYKLSIDPSKEILIFCLIFSAFAIKMPVFPFHTWQPDTYEQSPTAVTMVLSGIMVKMGVFAVIRWLLPILPAASIRMADVIIILSIIGMLYASLIAIRQDDMKRLIAYSSIAHIGLMSATMFTGNSSGMQGVMFQMFAHGVNVIGLWIVADVIEQKTGTRKFSELGGLAQKAPSLAILFTVLAFANIALPLTNAFIGEFIMFNALFQYNVWFASVALISIILAAVYTLWMVQKIFFGEISNNNSELKVSMNTQLTLAVLVCIIIFFGFYPKPMIDLTSQVVTAVALNK